jgi:YD repeat-containing protein
MTDANGHVMTYEYDRLNRRTKVIYADTTFDQTAYDAVGRVISKPIRPAKSLSTATTPWSLIRVTDALNQITQYSYDELGIRLSQTDALGRIRVRIRQAGPTNKAKSSAGSSRDLHLQRSGNLLTRRDFNAKTTTYAYDSMNRLLSKTPDASFAAPAITFTYALTGRRLTMNDAHGVTSYGYDSRDRLLSKATPEGTLSYTYDNASNTLSMQSSNTNGVSVDYGYDVLNRLSSVSGNASGTRAATERRLTLRRVGNLVDTYPNAVRRLINTTH